jgi:hypothetical protein
MAEKQWKIIKVRFCDHVDCEVDLEVEEVYPSEMMPDQPPRIRAHRCSRGVECSLFDKVACQWAGSNPVYDPFDGKEQS